MDVERCTARGRTREVRLNRIYLDPKRPRPSRREVVTRFVCGALFGLLLTGIVWVFVPWRFPSSISIGILIATAIPLICGALAAYLGDEFWERVFGRSLL